MGNSVFVADALAVEMPQTPSPDELRESERITPR